jgi:hypothetical protein
MTNKTQKKEGFVALISVVIISAILLLVAVTLSLSGYYGRYNILDSELKKRSVAIAEACVDTALLNLANNPSYTGNATTTIGSDACYVGTVTGAGTKTLKARSMYKNYYTDLKVVVNASTLSVVSWEETPSL